jgi:amino acid adenylation domain-containing protein
VAISRAGQPDPQATAITSPQGRTTFGQLTARSDAAARALAQRGVAPGSLVAIVGGVTEQTITTALAVMKAGCAFVPIDADEPPARRDAMAAAARPAAILVAAGAGLARADATPRIDVADILDVDPASDATARAPLPASAPHDLAYTLFTSGSTGTPRGVLVEHASIVNYVGWCSRAYRVNGRHPRVPVLAKFSQDASFQDIFGPLARGDAVWIPPPECRTDPAALLDLLVRNPGSGLHCVPTLWQELLAQACAAGRPTVPELAALFLGGDLVSPRLWERTCELLPRCLVANVYGPAEATVQVTGGFQGAAIGRSRGRLSVGWPIDGVAVDIRDERGEVVPAGAAGEVYISGVAVARGYLGDRDAHGFLPADSADGRTFRTGDEGCLLGDGSVVILGRLGGFGKIRGNRVEPGEVENVLTGLAGVREAIVGLTADARGDAELAAVVSSELTAAQIRGQLATRLPEYMVPTKINIQAERLRRTAHGKVDRSALDEPQSPGRSRAAASAASPRSPGRHAQPDAAARLRGIWCSVLSVPEVSAGDDFFQAGGHSVLAMRLVSRIRTELGVKVPLKELYDDPSFAALVSRVRRPGGASAQHGPAGSAGLSEGPVSIEQAAMLHAEKRLRGVPLNNVLLPLAVSGGIAEQRLPDALQALVAEHPALRTVYHPAGPGNWRQHILAPPIIGCEYIDLPVGSSVGERLRAAARFRQRPFALDREIPFRAGLLRVGGTPEAVLLVVHHIACDGASLNILADSLNASFQSPPAARLAGAPTYLDYAHWQLSAPGRAAIAADAAYWREFFAGLPGASPVPSAQPDGAHGGPLRRRLRLPGLAGLAVRAPRPATAPPARATPELATFIAAVSLALASVRPGPLLLRVLTQHRPAGFEHVVGLFANAVSLYVDTSAGQAAEELTAACREQLIDALDHQAAPFDLVLAELASQQRTRRATGVQPLSIAVDFAVDEPPAAAHQHFRKLSQAELSDGMATDQATGCDLSLSARRGDGGLTVDLECDEHVLPAGALDRLVPALTGQWLAHADGTRTGRQG